MATCSAGLRIRSWSKESCSYNFVAPKKWSLRKTVKRIAYIPCCILPSKNVHGSISTQSHGSIPQAHSWGGLNPLQAPTPVEKKKKQQATKGPEAKKNRDKSCIMYLLKEEWTKIKPMQTLPKNKHEENCYKVDGYKLIHYRKHCSTIIQSVRKFVLTTAVDTWTSLKNRLQNESCIKLHMYLQY